MKVSVIIPTYNEGLNIKILIPKIFEELNKLGVKGELIIVDDNSSDNTKITAKEMQKRFKELKMIYREKKLGIGSAYRRGVKEASGDIIVLMDGDLSHDPKYLEKIIPEFNNGGVDLVVGSRYVKGGKIVGWGWQRHLTSSVANRLSRLFLGIPIRDLTSGYRGFKKELIRKINFDKIQSNGYSFILETNFLACESKAKIKEIPIIFWQRSQGKSKLGRKEFLKYLITILRLFFSRI
ncbi:MAG: polyprenol monophosphomannose synthase [Candidatus Diapherotrites archaeon]